MILFTFCVLTQETGRSGVCMGSVPMSVNFSSGPQ